MDINDLDYPIEALPDGKQVSAERMKQIGWATTLQAAEHTYGCTCMACLIFFACTADPLDEEYGPFGRELIDLARERLAKPPLPTHAQAQADYEAFMAQPDEHP